MMASSRSRGFWRTFGPGILFASTCIGVSHLVQSTRAGAEYGFALLVVILAANLFKYPFFEFASRYTNATGDSILEGYGRVGRWVLWAYLIVTIGTMFIVTAAVASLTAGLMNALIGTSLTPTHWAAILLFGCLIVLAVGQYKFLDLALKFVSLILVVSVLIAVIAAFAHGPVDRVEGFTASTPWTMNGLGFLIPLMGWMPIAVDMSAWHSLWTQERIKQTGYHPTLKETLLDFNIGYLLSIVMALCFLSIGALLMFGSGEVFSNSAGGFAAQVVGLFTRVLGPWSGPVIGLAAFSTMFSTTITLIDGYGRSIERTVELLFDKKTSPRGRKVQYQLWLVALAVGAFLVLIAFAEKLLTLVDIATATSFLIAPLAALINLRILYNPEVPLAARPPKWLLILAWLGIVFLTLLGVLYLIR